MALEDYIKIVDKMSVEEAGLKSGGYVWLKAREARVLKSL
jgi:hypothetical protein